MMTGEIKADFEISSDGLKKTMISASYIKLAQ